MTAIYFMVGVLAVLAVALTWALALAWQARFRLALILWACILAAVAYDAWFLKSQSVWWWLSIFW